MKKKLSLYGWCQIGGWSTNLVVYLTMFFIGVAQSAPKTKPAALHYIPVIVLEMIAGFFLSHLMHLFWKKSGVVKLKVIKQIMSILLVIGFFAVIYSLITTSLYGFVSVARDYKFFPNFTRSASYYFILFSFWNLIYFLYFYIEVNRKQEINAIRFEAEFKIQQLENEKAQIEYQRNLGNYYLMALRYQMNPHFIFNCLNSIQLYIAQNDTASAADYLTKFSKLIRLVMENSAKGKILLSSELDMLRLYIDMEAMRFKEKLHYHIHLDKNVEPDYIELPPLLLQPYVENAIWHGLMPKEEGGQIMIDVGLNNNTNILEINITDDGIGRTKSMELRNGKAVKQDSYGMKITSDRIALINQVYKSGSTVIIDDLADNNNMPSGTKVSIQIPV